MIEHGDVNSGWDLRGTITQAIEAMTIEEKHEVGTALRLSNSFQFCMAGQGIEVSRDLLVDEDANLLVHGSEREAASE